MAGGAGPIRPLGFQPEPADEEQPSWFTTFINNPVEGVENFVHQHTGIGYEVNPNKPTGGTQALGWAYDQANRVGTAGLLAVNPDSQDFGDLGTAWRDAAQTNPGQAFMALPYNSLRFGQGDAHHAYGQVPTGAYGGIDVSDPTVRKLAENDFTFNATTAGANFLYSYFADPLVVGGKVAKPYLALARGRQVATPAQLVRESDRLSALGQKIEAGVPEGDLNAREQGWKHLYDNRHNIPYLLEYFGGRHSGIYKHEILANALSGTQDFNEFSTVYAAARGDWTAYNTLAAQAPAVRDALDRANLLRDSAEVANQSVPQFIGKGKTLRANPDFIPEWSMSQPDLAEATRVAEDAARRSDWLHRMMGDFNKGSPTVFGALSHNQLVSPLRAINEGRASVAAAEVGSWAGKHWADQIVSPFGQGGRTVHVMGWAGRDAAPGIIATSGSQAEGSWQGVRDVLKSAKVDDETIGNWVTQYVQASTPNLRQKVLVDMEHAVSTRLFRERLGPDATEQDKALLDQHVNAFFSHFQSERDAALADYHKHRGWVHDVDSGRSTKLAPYEDLEAQNVPIMDFQVLRQALQEYDQAGFRRALLTTRDRSLSAISAFSAIWKAGVLLRVGAVPRNLGESWLASWLYTGRFLQGNPVVGAGYGVGNIWRRWANATRLDTPDPLTHLTPREVRGLVEDRQAVLLRNKSGKTKELAAAIAESHTHLEAYYGSAFEHGSFVRPGDVMRAALDDTPEGMRPLLNATERREYGRYSAAATGRALKAGERANFRELHRKATQRYLQREHKGMHYVVERDGQQVKVMARDLQADDVLARDAGTTPRDLGESTIAVVHPYAKALAHNPKARAEALIQPGVAEPDWFTLRGQAASDAEDLRAAIARDDALIEETRQHLLDLDAAYGTKVALKARGREPLTMGGYTGLGSREGAAGQIAERVLSARGKNQMLLSTYEGTGASARRFGRRMNIVNGSFKTFDPSDPMFYAASTEVANRQVRNSELAMRLLETDDPEAVTKWLLGTDEGRGILRRINLTKTYDDAVAEWVYRAHYNLFRAYPSEALRNDILKGEVTEAQVRGYLHGRDDLVPTISREYLPSMRGLRASDGISAFVDKAFHFLWSLPEDKLARYPLYDSLYRAEWQRIVGDNMGHLQTLSQKQANDWIALNADSAARSYAQHTVQRVIYSSERRNNVAEKLRFISPFLQVTGNRFYFYGSQALENPQNVARMFIGWNAIPSDNQGAVAVHLPGAVAKRFGLEDMPTLNFQKSSFNLIQNGEPWWSPGVGPVVTVPAGEYLRRNADSPIAQYMTKVLGAAGVFPSGYLGQSVWDQVLPTWARRFMAGHGQQATNTQSMIMAVENWKFENGLRKTAPDLKEVNERNDQLWAFRVLAAFVSPAQPLPTNDMVQHYTEVFRKYTQQYGKDADAHFLADYPEYYDVVLSYTSNPTGIAPTQTASARESKNGYLIDSLPAPEMGAMITNLPGDNGKFDQSAYYWQMNRPLAPGSGQVIRGDLASTNSVQNRLVSRGWVEFRDISAKVKSLLLAAKQAGGSDDINAESNLWLRLGYDHAKDKIAMDTRITRPDGSTFSPWADDFAQQDNATYSKRAESLRLMLHPDYVKANIGVQPWLASGGQYLALRDQVGGLLEQAKRTGGSGDINAQDNLWLKIAWDSKRKAIADADPQWSEWASRYFSNDDLSTTPGSAA